MTPGRILGAKFYENSAMPVQPSFGYDRDAGDMCRSADSSASGVSLVPEVGWQLKDASVASPVGSDQQAFHSVGLGRLTVATTFVERDFWRQSGLPGVSYTGLAAAALPMVSRQVAAGGTFADWLTADQTAFDRPDTASDECSMDRVAKTTSADFPDLSVSLYIYVPQGAVTNRGPLATFYFSGPRGYTSKYHGSGSYAVKLYESGEARLFERGNDPATPSTKTWKLRKGFRWTPTGGPVERHTLYCLNVLSDVRDAGSGYVGKRITFLTFLYMFGSNQLVSSMASAAVNAVVATKPAHFSTVYTARQDPGQTLTVVQSESNRVDLRRDSRAAFAIARGRYLSPGIVQDDNFAMEYPPDEYDAAKANELVFEWYGNVPDGTDIDAALYDAETGTILVEVSPPALKDKYGGQRRFKPTKDKRHYRARFELSTSNADKTPTLESYRVYRRGVTQTVAQDDIVLPGTAGSPGLPVKVLSGFQATGQSVSPDTDNCVLELDDVDGTLGRLRTQGRQPVKVTSTENVSGSDVATVLWKGYVRTCRSRFKGVTGRNYPSPKRRTMQVECDSEWWHVWTQLSEQRFFLVDRETNKPYKVTDAIRLVLRESCGIPDSRLDIPDLDVRLFGDASDSVLLEPGQRGLDTCVHLARQYFGAYIVHDPNASRDWRFLPQKNGNQYNVLARFATGSPTGSGRKVPTLAAYGTTSGTSGKTGNPQTVVVAPIYRGVDEWFEPPEGNVVQVFTGVKSGGRMLSAGSGDERYMATWANPNGFDWRSVGAGNPGYPDVTHPDFLGSIVPIQIEDGSLSSQAEADWIARRVGEYATHGRNWLSFQAPLVLVTDADDTYQLTRRPLRIYDVVEVKDFDDGTWKKYLVSSVSQIIKKEYDQRAVYELVRPSNIDTVGVV